MNYEAEILIHERKLLQPDFRRNREAVAALLAEDFREFGSSGRVWNKQQILDHLETEPPFEAEIDEFQAVELAPGALLVTYTVTIQSADSEIRKSLRSSVWIKRVDSWRMMFHQGTRLAASA